MYIGGSQLSQALKRHLPRKVLTFAVKLSLAESNLFLIVQSNKGKFDQ